MEKLLFFARTDTVLENTSVSKKVNREFRFFQEVYDTYMISQSGFSVIVSHKNDFDILCKTKSRMKHLFNINNATLETIKKNNIKKIYMRYPKCNPIFLSLLKRMKNLGCRIIIEMPTFPYDGEKKAYGKGFHNRLIFLVDKMCRNKMRKYVYRFATYDDSDYIFGVKAFRIVNGVFVDDLRKRNVRSSQEEINIIGVASMQLAHGYDRLIEGLKEYYSGNKDTIVRLLLVGDGNEKSRYESLVEKYNLNEYVEFYGYCAGQKLDELYDKADIAVECLAGFRNGLTISSSLKSREYFAKGLPMISDLDIDVLSSDYPYVMKVLRNESRIDVSEIVNFYHGILSKENSESVANKIREFCVRNCDLRKTMLPVVNAFDND